MRTVAGLLLAVALVAGCGGGSESSDTPTTTDAPAAGPSGGLIAFDNIRDVGFDIFVMNADGTEVRQLTDNDDDDHSPAWSPDGKHIAFVSDRDGDRIVRNSDIFVMIDYGNEVRQLTDSDSGDHSCGAPSCGNGSPAWSPDGTRIAFNGSGDGDGEIFVMNADGTEVRQLTDNDDDDHFPAWSPDSKHIAFMSHRDGDDEIFVMNADGTEVRQLTNNDDRDVHPAWSPDGKHIAFVSDRDDSEIFVMNADGTDVYSTGQEGYRPSWGG